MKFLIIDDEDTVLEIMSIFLESIFTGIDIVQTNSGNMAISILKNDPHFDCIISDYNMQDGKGDTVLDFVVEQNLQIPFFLCTACSISEIQHFFKKNLAGVIIKPFSAKTLRESLSKVIKVIPTHDGPEHFCRIRPSYLLKLGITPSDLYIKINENKFIKVMYKGEYFESHDLDHYAIKNLNFLYLKNKDFIQTMSKMEAELKRLNQLQKIPDEDILEVPALALSIVFEFYRKFGISESIQRTVRETVDLTLKAIRQQPNLNNLFKRLKENQDHYFSYHSALLAHVSTTLAAQMEWTSITTNQKLAMASFLHDITMDDWSIEKTRAVEKKIKNLAGTISDDLELEKYKKHPLDSAELFLKINESIPDVHLIIAQHHEAPDGSGFPHKLNATTIAPLSATLIVAHQIVDAYLDSSNELDLVEFVNKLPDSYNKGNFKQVTRALRTFAMKSSGKNA